MSDSWPNRLKNAIRARLSPQNLKRARIVGRSVRDLRATFEREPVPTYPIGIDELRATLLELGIKKGDLLHVQSSLSHLYRGAVKPPPEAIHGKLWAYAENIITLLQDLVGESGTIMMLTAPPRPVGWLRRLAAGHEIEDDVFDPALHVSTRGLISECFRKRPDVVRSVHPFYNVSVWGRLREDLIMDHHRSTPYAMDIHSPWYKLTTQGGKVLLLGITFHINSLFRLVEYLHPEEFPRPIFMNRPVQMGYLDHSGRRQNIDVRLHCSGAPGSSLFNSPQSQFEFGEYINSLYGIYTIKQFQDDVRIVCYDAKAQYEACVSEMRRGVTIYDPQFQP